MGKDKNRLEKLKAELDRVKAQSDEVSGRYGSKKTPNTSDKSKSGSTEKRENRAFTIESFSGKL